MYTSQKESPHTASLFWAENIKQASKKSKYNTIVTK